MVTVIVKVVAVEMFRTGNQGKEDCPAQPMIPIFLMGEEVYHAHSYADAAQGVPKMRLILRAIVMVDSSDSFGRIRGDLVFHSHLKDFPVQS